MFGGGIQNKNLSLIKFFSKIMISKENLVKLGYRTKISNFKIPSRPLKLKILGASIF